MVSIGPTIQIKGEDQYRLSIRKIIQETKELSSEMDLLVSAFEKNTSVLDKTTRKHELYAKQIESTQKQNEKIAEGLEMANQKHQQAIKAYEEHAKKLESLKDTQAKYQAELKRAWETGGTVSEDMTKKIAENEQAIKDAEAQTAKYTDEVARSGRVLADWETASNKAETELNNLQQAFRDTAPIKAWGAQLEDTGKKVSDVGESLSKYITAPLTALGGLATKAAMDFEDGMAKIYTIAMDSTEPMGKMQKELIELSNNTGFALDDLTEATYQTVSASVDATDAVDFMTQAVKLARAGYTTTTKAVDILTTVMNSYGKETYDVAYLNDLLLKTQNDGKVIIDQLASSIGVIIPLAANYHVGIEQIAAAYATMTKQGVPAERATTFMRALFTELENQSKDVAEVLKNETGKSFAQLMDQGYSLADVLEILYNKMDKNSESYQQLFKNVRSGQAAASLAADGFSVLRTELERMENVTGLTDRALEQMETTSLKLKRSTTQLKNSAVVLGEGILDMAMPAFEKFTSKVKELTDSFTALSPEATSIIASVGAFAIALPPVIALTGKILTYIGGLLAGTASLVPLIAGVTAAVVGVATAIAVSNQAHIDAIKNEYGLSEAMKEELTELENLKTSHYDFMQSMQEKNTATLDQVAYMQELATQYDALVDKNGKISESDQALADMILGELASALGMEVDQVKALIDENGKLSQSIQQNIEDYKKEAFAATLKEEIKEATQRKIEAERIEKDIIDQLAVATDNQKRATRDREAAQKAINDAIANGEQPTQQMIADLADATTAEDQATRAVWDLRDGLATAQDQIGQASSDVDYYSDRLVNLENESKKAADQVEKDSGRAKTATENAANGAKTAVTGAAKEAYNSGANLARGFANGISDYAYLSAGAASTMGANATRLLKYTLHEQSPSKVTAEIGKYFVEGFANPIKEGISEMGYLAEKLGESAISGLSMGSYMPETGAVYNKQITAPISVNLTVNGNVDDPDKFVRDIGDKLADILTRNNEVFA